VIVGQVFDCEPFSNVRSFSGITLIRHFPTTTSNPALRDSVLPWTPDACANGFNAARLQELDDITAEFGIPVQHNVPLGQGKGNAFSQLLYDPLARRVRRGVEVHNTAAACSITNKQYSTEKSMWTGLADRRNVDPHRRTAEAGTTPPDGRILSACFWIREY